MTEKLFLKDAYLRSTDAQVIDVTETGIVTDKTIFYARGGGQPGDSGALLIDGETIPISEAVYAQDRAHIVHIPENTADLTKISAGKTCSLEIDWDKRYDVMRMHSCMHLLSVVLAFPVTGGQISIGEGRLDFDMPELPADKEELNAQLNALITQDHAISDEWITDAELEAKPDLVKTMAVKPPMGSGHVRLVRIGDIDLQPCGGTHVKSTAEIGAVAIGKIEKKGKINRRVRVKFA